MVGALKLLKLSLMPTGRLTELMRNNATSKADREAVAAILEERRERTPPNVATRVGFRSWLTLGVGMLLIAVAFLMLQTNPPAALELRKSLQEVMRLVGA